MFLVTLSKINYFNSNSVLFAIKNTPVGNFTQKGRVVRFQVNNICCFILRLIKRKKRARQEWKNVEMKNLHGLHRARGYGLTSMSRQAKLNFLKRIASILSSLKLSPLISITIFFKDLDLVSIFKFKRKKVDFFSGPGRFLCHSRTALAFNSLR